MDEGHTLPCLSVELRFVWAYVGGLRFGFCVVYRRGGPEDRRSLPYEVRARSGRVARGAMEGRLSDERNARFWLKIFASTQLCQDHPEELWTIPTVGSS